MAADLLEWAIARGEANAHARSSHIVTSDDIALGLLESTEVVELLRALGVQPAHWSGEIRRYAGHGSRQSAGEGQLRLSRDADAVLELVRSELELSGRRVVEPGHLLAAIRGVGYGTVASAIAGRLGLTVAAIRQHAGWTHRRRVVAEGAPRNSTWEPKRTGALMLHGGGSPVGRALIEEATQWATGQKRYPRSSVLQATYLNLASYSDNVAPDVALAFKECGLSLKDAGVYSRSDAFVEEYCERIRRSDIIFVEGGRPEIAYDALWATPALSALQEASDSGTTIVGRSAGAVVWGLGMISDFESGDEKEPFLLFGWLERVMVFPHWSPELEPYFDAHLARFPGAVGLGIDHQGAVLIKPGWEWVCSVDGPEPTRSVITNGSGNARVSVGPEGVALL